MDKERNIILITGATGNQGGAVARQLLAKGYRVRALTRNARGEKARGLAARGAEVVEGNLDDVKSLVRALDGVWGVHSVQNTWEAGVAREEEQGIRLAELAWEKGVNHFVYSSVGSAHRKTGIPHFDNKWRVEEKVRSLGFPSYTILRPVFFMENFTSPWFKPGILKGVLEIGLKPDTVLQMVAVEDIGRFGLLAFEEHERMNGVALDFAGDQRTMPETAEIIGRAMGREVGFERTPIEEVRKWSADFTTMLEWFDSVGYCADIERLEEQYGLKLVKLPEWAARANWG